MKGLFELVRKHVGRGESRLWGGLLAVLCFAQETPLALANPAGCDTMKTIDQGEIRDPKGKLIREAAKIYVLSCTCGEGRNIYIYQYTKRPSHMPGYRAICYPDWGNALGGRDFQSFEEAEKAAVSGSGLLNCYKVCMDKAGSDIPTYMRCTKIPKNMKGTPQQCNEVADRVLSGKPF
jgi:hypothetical protein